MTDDIKAESVRDEADHLSFMPGQRLKKAREARGLTVEQVAKELRLSMRFVHSMEADSYKHLPEPTFVRGYMRRYAQLVKLSPDDIASKFDQCYADDGETPPVDERPRNPVQLLGIITSPRLRLRRILSWASIALIIALALGFLWSGFHSDRPTEVPAVDVPILPAPANEAAPPPATSAPALTPAASAQGVSAATSIAVLPTPASSVSMAAVPVVAVPAAASAFTIVPAVASGPDTLMLTLSAESWVSVRDIKRQPLLSTVRPAGQIALKGEAPFYVNIGNASVVTLVFNGKTVDLKPYTQGAVATLTLKR